MFQRINDFRFDKNCYPGLNHAMNSIVFPQAFRNLAAAVLLGFCCFASGVAAVEIRVSQESSPGAGDFDAHVLSTIEPFSTSVTAETYYGFDFSNYSYNQTEPPAVVDRT